MIASEEWIAREPVSLASLRIGIAQGMPLDKLEEPVARAFDAALKRLSAAGARLVETALPEIGGMVEVNTRYGGITPAEAFYVHRERLDTHGDRIDPNVRQRIEKARTLSAADYIAMLRRRAELVRAVDARLAEIDVVIMPTSPVVAPVLAELDFAGDVGTAERDVPAQHVDVEFLRHLRDLAAAAARRRSAGRADARRPPWPRRAAVQHCGSGGAVSGISHFAPDATRFRLVQSGTARHYPPNTTAGPADGRLHDRQIASGDAAQRYRRARRRCSSPAPRRSASCARRRAALKVGVLLPRSGFQAGIGQDCQRGVDIAGGVLKDLGLRRSRS